MTVTYHGLGQHGRLGNQLFQIAGTIGIANRLDEPAVFDPDWAYRPFFNMPDDWFYGYLADAGEASASATHLPLRWRKYMQDPNLFAEVADAIKVAFAPSPRAMAVLDALPEPAPSAVAVHVRRTDYKGRDGYLDMLPTYYYRAAAGQLRAHSPIEFHVYGDDLRWAADYLPDGWQTRSYGDTVTDEPTDWADLMQMSRYRRIIVANSSYSWWAAWLSDDAQVVAPDPWFGRLIAVPSPALPTWEKISWR